MRNRINSLISCLKVDKDKLLIFTIKIPRKAMQKNSIIKKCFSKTTAFIQIAPCSKLSDEKHARLIFFFI